MSTRNPANVIEFGVVNFGATITIYSVTGATGVDLETAPGEDLERFIEVVGISGLVIGLGEENGGSFNVYVEQSSWDETELQSAVQAIGGVFASATITDAGL